MGGVETMKSDSSFEIIIRDTRSIIPSRLRFMMDRFFPHL